MKGVGMSAEANKVLLRQYFEEVWDRQNLEMIDEFLAPNYKRHRSPTAAAFTRDGQKQLLSQFRTAFPDIHITIEEIIAEENRLALRSTMRGTHQGEFLGIAPTGNKIEVGLLDVIHIEDGKFVEQWGGPDMLSLLQQLGVELP
jgi:steroid delta-isomerase-like uncharacterized protein